KADSELGLSGLMTCKFGWTVRDSQSGYQAPREFLARQFPSQKFTGQSIGPLLNPRGIMNALLDGEIDAGAVDAYAWHLLSLHEPETIAQLKVLATTQTAPMPLLI